MDTYPAPSAARESTYSDILILVTHRGAGESMRGLEETHRQLTDLWAMPRKDYGRSLRSNQGLKTVY